MAYCCVTSCMIHSSNIVKQLELSPKLFADPNFEDTYFTYASEDKHFKKEDEGSQRYE